MNRVIFGDCRDTMRDLKAQGVRVQCCVTTIIDDADYDHEGWFFGAAAVPNWLGYTLGKRMVDRFLAAHPQMTALRLAHADTEIFRQTLAAPF